jgi:hypothetical protein
MPAGQPKLPVGPFPKLDNDTSGAAQAARRPWPNLPEVANRRQVRAWDVSPRPSVSEF